MSDSLPQVILYYIGFPAAALVLGGVLALFRSPTQGTRSVIQHFAAGVVFSAVAVELLPELTREQRFLPLTVGFGLGVGLMLLVRRLATRLEGDSSHETARSSFAGLITAVAVDVFVDGALMGTSFAAGTKTGVLITLALTLELFFLGLATSASLSKSITSPRYPLTVLVFLALVLMSGAALGVTVFAGLSGRALIMVLAFATAALLYLVTEELLLEAHDIPDTSLATTMFFAGFLSLMIIEMTFR